MPVKTVAKPNVRRLELNEAVAYMAQSIAEMSQRIADSQAESDAKIAKSKAETDAKMAKSKAETDAKIARSDAKMAESQAKTDRAIQKLTESQAESQAKTDIAIRDLRESQAETSRAIDRLTANIDRLTARVDEVLTGFGTVGDRFGTLTELVVIPGLRRAINVFGHDFRRSFANKKFYYIDERGKKQPIPEIDLFLTNGTEAMAVEVKASLNTSYVNKHIGKLKTMRKYDGDTGLKNKKLYGAVVGIYIDEDARKLALKNGLYVVEIQEEEKKLKTEKPTKCHVW